MDATQISTIEALPPERRKKLSSQDKRQYVIALTGLSAWYIQVYPWDDPVPVAAFYKNRQNKRKAPAPVARCPYCGKRESRCKCS